MTDLGVIVTLKDGTTYKADAYKCPNQCGTEVIAGFGGDCLTKSEVRSQTVIYQEHYPESIYNFAE